MHRQRRQQAEDRQKLLQLSKDANAADEQAKQLNADRSTAQIELNNAGALERPVEQLVKEADELHELAKVEGDAQQLSARLKELEARKTELERQWHDLSAQRAAAQEAWNSCQNERLAPAPEDVTRFRRVLRNEGIEHYLMADVTDITDDHWRAAAEGVLRGSRGIVLLKNQGDEARAMACAERERYRHYVVTDTVQVSGKVPSWLAKQLGQIRRVERPTTKKCVARTAESPVVAE